MKHGCVSKDEYYNFQMIVFRISCCCNIFSGVLTLWTKDLLLNSLKGNSMETICRMLYELTKVKKAWHTIEDQASPPQMGMTKEQEDKIW